MSIAEILKRVSPTIAPIYVGKDYSINDLRNDLIALANIVICSCQHCGKSFEAGVGTGRRADAKFCSKQHQIAFNSLKRSRES